MFGVIFMSFDVYFVIDHTRIVSQDRLSNHPVLKTKNFLDTEPPKYRKSFHKECLLQSAAGFMKSHKL
jgi:hypothetical protein